MSVVAELDTLLQSMLELKPPGANQQKISGATTLCTANIKSETVLIQKLYTHFKKAPANYKLGALYVVDSIARHWLDQAKRAGQELGPSAPDGTFAAGVHHVTELLPSFMSDIAAAAPEEHKAKIKKLIDIWRRGGTFPANMIAQFESKLNSANAQSTTPTGTPPQSAVALATNAMSSTPANDAAAAHPAASNNLEETLKLLRGMAQSAAPSSTPVQAATPTPFTNPMQMPQMPQSMPVNGDPMQFPGVGGQQQQQQQTQQPNFNGMLGGNNAFASLLGAQQQQQPQQMQQQQQPFPQLPAGLVGMSQQTMSNTPTPAGANGQPDMMKQLQILAQLKAANVPQEQWASLLPVLMSMPQNGGAGAGGAVVPGMPAPTSQGSYAAYGADQSRDSNAAYDQIRSPTGRDSGGRRRSRSPDRRGGGRDSPSYDRYDRGEREREGRRGGRGRDRRRSPDRFRRTPSPHGKGASQGVNDSKYPLPEPGPKKIEYDPSLPKDSIRVFSRTLFVGGVTCSEDELRQIFAAFGRVQTCIVNIDKRHAFVKMISREEAELAKEQMEHYPRDNMQLRTRWGVGYGPRDCSDYATGVSVIPIQRLTDADRKWMLSAEFGGSGGKPIETGLVVEEPDIEIGAGVSSKAISRRMQTDRSGQHGPRSTKDQGGNANANANANGSGNANGNANGNGNSNGNGGGRWGRGGRDEDNPNNISIAPQVPGYGQFNMASLGQNGMNFGQGF